MKWSGPGPQERSKPDEGPTNVALDKPLQRRIDDRGWGRYVGIPLARLRNRVRYKRAMWSTLIVVQSPRFDPSLRVGDRRELVHVQAFIAQPTVERLDERVFYPYSLVIHRS